jgi:hypothetical protein
VSSLSWSIDRRRELARQLGYTMAEVDAFGQRRSEACAERVRRDLDRAAELELQCQCRIRIAGDSCGSAPRGDAL